MNTTEARQAVKEIAAAENSAEAACVYALGQASVSEYVHADPSIPAPELDRLKAAEYGLLVGPISLAVEMYLADPPALFDPHRYYKSEELARTVGEFVFARSWELLQADAAAMETAKELAEERGRLVNNERYAELITPLGRTMKEAAISSVHSTGNMFYANALTVQRDAGDTLIHEEQVAVTRNSHHLALVHPLVHIADTVVLSLITNNYCGAVMRGHKFEKLLRYDPATQKVVLAKNLQQWPVGPDMTIEDSKGKNVDVKIGCPFSFAAKDVRVGYYEAMVDLLVAHGKWPVLL